MRWDSTWGVEWLQHWADSCNCRGRCGVGSGVRPDLWPSPEQRPEVALQRVSHHAQPGCAPWLRPPVNIAASKERAMGSALGWAFHTTACPCNSVPCRAGRPCAPLCCALYAGIGTAAGAAALGGSGGAAAAAAARRTAGGGESVAAARRAAGRRRRRSCLRSRRCTPSTRQAGHIGCIGRIGCTITRSCICVQDTRARTEPTDACLADG